MAGIGDELVDPGARGDVPPAPARAKAEVHAGPSVIAIENDGDKSLSAHLMIDNSPGVQSIAENCACQTSK